MSAPAARLPAGPQLIGYPFDAVAKVAGVEIDQKTYALVEELQVGEQLFGKDGLHFFARFQFNNDLVVDQQIETDLAARQENL